MAVYLNILSSAGAKYSSDQYIPVLGKPVSRSPLAANTDSTPAATDCLARITPDVDIFVDWGAAPDTAKGVPVFAKQPLDMHLKAGDKVKWVALT